jgi:hypothetical protein
MKYIPIIISTIFYSLFVHFTAAQTAGADNKPSKSITFRPIPKGPSVFGVFEGRPPCAGMAGQLKLAITPECIKLKCVLTLYRDSITLQPTRYTFLILGGGDVVNKDGNSYRQKEIAGNWEIVKGTKSDPEAVVYQLELNKPKDHFNILQGDENVLFILDENKEFRVGNENFSYTLNRVELVSAPHKNP